MKSLLLLTLAGTLLTAGSSVAQVTQIDNNHSLSLVTPISNSRLILTSGVDKTLWVTEGTAVSTVAITTDIKLEGWGTLLNNKFYFSGSTAGTGVELYVTDGTASGTQLVSDIVAGTTSSFPGDFMVFNNAIYFTAITPAEGRELWKTDGTPGGTVFVKDINPGPASSNDANDYHLIVAYNKLMFVATNGLNGKELWTSDGTIANTSMLKDINAGLPDSEPEDFHWLGNTLMFTAKTAAEGRELWKTDGTTGGTVLIKDILAGATSSVETELFPGFSFKLLLGFHNFNNKAYFQANDGSGPGTLYVTDGTTAGTQKVKTILSTGTLPILLVSNAVHINGVFIFPVSNGEDASALWESDGTTAGTEQFKAFDVTDGSTFPLIWVNYNNFSEGPVSGLWNNRFYFSAGTTASGNELWSSDGTLGNTIMVADLSPNSGDGIQHLSYFYAGNTMLLAGNNGVLGDELYSHVAGSSAINLVKDIFPGEGNADPTFIMQHNNLIYFTATDGDDPNRTDLFVMNGNFNPLPAKLGVFTAAEHQGNALVQWQTLEEKNTKQFMLQRSVNGRDFNTIANVAAKGNSSIRQHYQYTDAAIARLQTATVYYRLLTVDADGRIETSPTAILHLNQPGIGLRLLGNAPGGKPMAAITGLKEKGMLALSDMHGRMVWQTVVQPGQPQLLLEVPVTQLSTGAYNLVLTSGTSRIQARLVK